MGPGTATTLNATAEVTNTHTTKGNDMSKIKDLSINYTDEFGDTWPCGVSDDERFSLKASLDAGEVTAQEIANDFARQLASYDLNEEEVTPQHVEVTVIYYNGPDSFAGADVRYPAPRRSTLRYPDVKLAGEIGEHRFFIKSNDDVGQVLLEVTTDGAGTSRYYSTVGEALRRLSVVIGEG